MEQRKKIYSAWPFFEEDEIAAAAAVLRSGKVNYWTGEEGKSFEREFAEYIGSRYSVALSNGTVALELALRASGIGPGDEVVVAPRTFVASASAAVICGARPVFADVDRKSGNITAETIGPVLSEKTRAIIPVHLGGWPCAMDPIMELARRENLVVIEDCAQAHGAEYWGKKAGSIGDLGAFSFCQDKILTTGGEGGMITTDNEEYWSRIWSFKDHGKDFETVFNKEHPPGFRWLHETFGTNARMTEMQAAIGRRALAKLPDRLARRARNAGIYMDKLSGHPALIIPSPGPEIKPAWYRFYCYLLPEALKPGWNRDRVMEVMSARGRPGLSGTCCEIYLENAFSSAGLRPPRRLPAARWLTENSLMLPVHPALKVTDTMDIAATLLLILEEAVR